MKLFRVISCEIKKIVFSINFLGAVLVATLLYFTSYAYENEATGSTYSVIEVVFGTEKKIIMSNYHLSNYMLFFDAFSKFSSLFIILVAAFPFSFYFCNERKTRYSRCVVQKEGIKNYLIGKIVGCFVSGGLITSIALIIYGSILFFAMPSPLLYPEYTGQVSLSNIVGYIISAFLFGGFIAIPSMVLCMASKNAYIISSVPFLFFYVWDTMITRLENIMLLSENYVGFKNLKYFRYDCILRINIINFTDMHELALFLFPMVLVIVQIMIFMIIAKRKKEIGV